MNRRAFSLLEVIIATGILAASAVMLMSMFSTGDRHTRRADERTIAQMLCLSKLDELVADPSLIIPVKSEVIRQFPGWTWSLDVQETTVPEFVQITVSVTHIPGTDTGADLDLATKEVSFGGEAEMQKLDSSVLSSLPKEPTYELTRWMKFEGDVSLFETSQSGVGGL